MKIAIAYEPVCINGVHAPFVAGMLESLLTVYDRLVFVADPTEIAIVNRILSPALVSRIQWESCPLPPSNDYRFWHRLPAECRILKQVVKLARDNDADVIVGLSFTRPGLAAAKIFSRFMAARIDYGVVAHMILAELSTSRRDRWLVRFGNPRRFKILVLGRSTLSAALGAFACTDRVFRSVSHPYPMADAPGSVGLPTDGPLVFGFPGLASEGKGFSIFLNLAEKLHSPAARFIVIGRVLDDCPSRDRAARLVARGVVSIMSMGSARISIEDFRHELQQLQYLVYPYSADAYELVNSGAAIDALWAARPLIASRIPMFEDLFARIGDVGYMCESEEQFISTIERLIAMRPTSQYECQSRNLVAGRLLFSSPAVGSELRAALSSKA